MNTTQARKLKDLERENLQLKKLVADLSLEWWLRPVRMQVRVGEHSAVVCIISMGIARQLHVNLEACR